MVSGQVRYRPQASGLSIVEAPWGRGAESKQRRRSGSGCVLLTLAVCGAAAVFSLTASVAATHAILSSRSAAAARCSALSSDEMLADPSLRAHVPPTVGQGSQREVHEDDVTQVRRPNSFELDEEGWPSFCSREHGGSTGRDCHGFLLSYPRSGNHLARTMIEFLLEQPTLSVYAHDIIRNGGTNPHKTGGTRTRTGLVEALYPEALPGSQLGTPAEWAATFREEGRTRVALWKTHDVKYNWLSEFSDNMFLIYLVRDPAESIASELKTRLRLWRWATKDEERARDTIVENTRVFQAWRAPKLLLRYEEMTSAPEAAMRRLGHFLRVPPARVELCASHAREIAQLALRLTERQAVSASDPWYYHAKPALRTSLATIPGHDIDATGSGGVGVSMAAKARGSFTLSSWWKQLLNFDTPIPIPGDVWFTITQPDCDAAAEVPMVQSRDTLGRSQCKSFYEDSLCVERRSTAKI